MPQTTLALLALALASTLALNQSKTGVYAQADMVRNEVDVHALGVATEVFEIVSTKDFDEATTGTLISDVPPEGMSAPSTFGSGKDLLDPGTDDVDDVHDMAPHRVVREVTDPETGERSALEFEVTATVEYVTDRDPVTGAALPRVTPTGQPTYTKRVELTVRCPSLRGPLLDGYRVVVSRLFSY